MTATQTARNVLAAACVVGVLYVAWLLRDVLLLVVLAGFLAVALSGPVNLVELRLRVPRAAAILIVFLRSPACSCGRPAGPAAAGP